MNLIIPGESKRLQLVETRDLTGGFETVAIEDIGDKRIYHYAQQTGYILNDNERMRRDNPDWNRKRELRQVASVPQCIWELWETAGITMDQKELRKALMRHRDEYMVVEKNLI